MPGIAKKTFSGRRVLLVLLAILIVAISPIVIFTWACQSSQPRTLFLGQVPAFTLVDERGQPFTEAALRDHVTIISFVFTRCDTICPVTTMKMQKLQDKTFDAGTSIKLVSLSVDPAYDTPARLAEYAKRYGADPTRWRFVTGDAAAMRGVVEGALMNSMQQEGTTPTGTPNIAHSGRFMLIDGNLEIRGAYDSGDVQSLDELIRSARYLVRTQRRPG